MARLLIHPRDLETVERHAVAAYPEECCGLLVGSAAAGGVAGGSGSVRVGWVEPCPNRAPRQRRRRFTIAPEALLAAYRRALARGQQVVGCYHSHVDGSAVPSARDRESAWPGSSYLIVGLEGARVRERRSWRLDPDARGFVEEEVALRGGRRGGSA